MKKKVFLAVALFATMALGLQAQESRGISFRINAGASVSRIAYAMDPDRYPLGYRAGFSVDLPFQDILSIRPTLLAVQKGDQVSLPVGKATLRPLYVQMPIYLNVYMPYSKNAVWYANLGPYVAYGVTGKYQPSKDALDKKEHNLFAAEMTILEDGKEVKGTLLNPWDAGLSGNVGVEFGHVILEAGMDVGVMNVANELKTPADVPGWTLTSPKNFNVSAHFSLGWRF